MSDECRCAEISELREAAAKTYADQHLAEVEVRASRWEVVFSRLDTGAEWPEDHPNGEQRGGEVPRLVSRHRQRGYRHR